MNLKQAAHIGRLAKAKGLAVRVEGGNVQIVRVTYSATGTSTVTPVTPFISYEAAIEAINGEIK